MAYDAMGNYTGFDEGPVSPYDFEEEEKRKEQLKRELEAAVKAETELASQVSRKEEITEYGDGSRTVKTTKEIPAGGKVQPVAPDDYNANIARQESGNRPDIGYHDRNKGSAYGTYGMTAAGYEDARRVNPNLPADITQATPEQQTQAQNAYTQQNAKYLQNYGVEPTPNNLAAAHFLGAKGLSDYLKTGAISEAAAKANGGVENVKRIVDQRLGGQAAPASGASNLMPGEQGGMPTKKPQLQPISPDQAQQEQPQGMTGTGLKMPGQPAMQGEDGSKSFIDRYQNDQNDPGKLMQLSSDESAPEYLRERSRNRAADIITQQREMQNAQEKLASATPTDLAKYMREKTTGGSYVKAIFYAAIGAKSLAQEEAAKLGIGTEKVIVDANGKSNIIKVAANGTPLDGYSAETGKKLSAEDLISAMGSAGAPKKDIVGGTYVNDKTGEVGRVVSDPRTGVSYVQTDKGRKPMEGFRPQGQTGTMDMQKAQQIQRQNIDLQGDWAKLQMQVQGAAPEAANKYLGEFNAKHGTKFGLQSISGSAPQISMETGQMVQPAPTAQAQPQTAPAQTQAAPAASGKVTPVAPSGTTAVTPVAPGQAAVAQSPADIESQRKKREEQEKIERDLGKTSSEGVIKHRDEKLVPAADGGQQGSDIVRRQFAVMNDSRSDALFGLMNKAQSMSTSDKNWAVVRDVLAGKIDSREAAANLPAKWVETNLNSDQKSLLETMKADTAALATATIKSGGFGAQVSDRDRVSAEKMQLDIAEVPALGMFQGKAQQLFNFDMSRAKSDWASTKNFSAVDQLERAWRKEQTTLVEQYGKIADERNAFIKANSDGKPATIGLVRDAYRRYPVPQYDPNLNTGEGGWRNLRKRDLNDILKGNR
jgi:hypothetical protein